MDWQSAEALSALDEEAGVLYTLLYHRPGPYLIGLDLASSTVVANVSLVAEFMTQQFDGVGQFVAAMGGGRLVVGGDTADGLQLIGVLDVTSCTYSRLVVGGDTADGLQLIGVLDVTSCTYSRSALLPKLAQDTSSSSAANIPDYNSFVVL